MARLPQPGGDQGSWGDILNEYLSQAHKPDGNLKDNIVTGSALAADAVTGTTIQNSSITPVKLNSDTPATGDVLSYNGSGFEWITPAAASGSGETNTASNVGTGGTGLYKQKTGVNLEFKRLRAASNKLSVTDNTGNDTVDLDVLVANLGLTKSDVGLANVDNTSDANKPISTATQTALNAKATDATTVHITGTETITGAKNFTGGLQTGGQAVVATNDSRLSDQRVPTDNSVSATKLQSDSVTEPKLSATNAASNGQLLSYNGANFTWVNAPAGGGDPVMGGDISGNASNAQIVAGVITNTEVSASAAIAQSKIANLTTDLATKADDTTTVSGGTSLTGGGDLTANRTLTLVNDSATPGNSRYYGTDGSGAKGYHTLPAGGDPTMGGDISGNASNAQIVAGVITNTEVSASANIAQSKISNLTTDLAGKSSTSHTHTLNDLSDVSTSGVADGQVLKYNSGSWAPAADDTAAGGSGELQSSLVVVRPAVGDNNTIQAYCREHGQISSSTTDATVIQAAIDHVSNFAGSTGHTGGRVQLAAYRFSITAPIMGRPVTWGSNPTVWPVVIEGEGGINGGNAGANSSGSGGTVLVWAGGSSPTNGGRAGALAGAVLNLSEDCHGYKVKELVVEGGNEVANYAAVSAGRGIEWHSVRFRNFGQRGLFVTNGDDDISTDPYVQARIYHCRAESSDGIGFYIASSRAGKGCTDGRIRDLQANSCAGGSIHLGAGGWGINGGHITMSTATAPNMVCDAGFTHITNIYFDTCGNNPGIRLDNNSVAISNCFFLMDGKSSSAAIEAGGRSGVTVANCLWNDTSGSGQYFFRGTSSAQSVIGCVGPSNSLTGGIFAAGFTGYSAGNISHA